MKPQACLMAAAALIVTASLALAAETPPAPKKPEPAKAMSGDAALMIAECKLTAEQKAKLLDASNASLKAITEWNQANSPKLASLQKALAAAREAGNTQEVQRLQAEAQALTQQMRDLVRKGQQAVLAILTPEQRLSWREFQLYRQVMRNLQATNLTPLQAGKCRAMCREAAPELAGISGEGEESLRARDLILQRILDRAKKEILTPEQQAALAKEPPKAPPTEPLPPPTPKG
jgi:Spy/CpxP family protein refolding chaperone